MIKKRGLTLPRSNLSQELVFLCDEFLAFKFFLFEFFGVATFGITSEAVGFFAVGEFLVLECDFAVEFTDFADGFKLGIHLGDGFYERCSGGAEGFFLFVAFVRELALFFTLAFFAFFAFLLFAFLFALLLFEEFVFFVFEPAVIREFNWLGGAVCEMNALAIAVIVEMEAERNFVRFGVVIDTGDNEHRALVEVVEFDDDAIKHFISRKFD